MSKQVTVLHETVNSGSMGNPEIPVSVYSAEQERARILYLGGFQQPAERMQQLLLHFAQDADISSVGFNAFDTVEPTREVPGGRMRQRAAVLNYVASVSLRSLFPRPDVVVTHCAAANVLLLARQVPNVCGYIPDKGILIEPMIAESLERSHYTRGFGKQEVKHKKQPDSYVSIHGLGAQNGERATDREILESLLDIVLSEGIHNLAHAVAEGAAYTIVMSEDDYAAPRDVIEDELEGFALTNRVPVVGYDDQELFGHGYLLAEPRKALKTIVPIIHELKLL